MCMGIGQVARRFAKLQLPPIEGLRAANGSCVFAALSVAHSLISRLLPNECMLAVEDVVS